MTIAVDFDGTIVTHKYPAIGEEIPFAIDTLKTANRDYPEETTDNNPHFSRKLKVDIFIDDRNLGGLPDWGTIYRMIKQRHKWNDVIDEVLAQSHLNHTEPPKKKHWWQF